MTTRIPRTIQRRKMAAANYSLDYHAPQDVSSEPEKQKRRIPKEGVPNVHRLARRRDVGGGGSARRNGLWVRILLGMVTARFRDYRFHARKI